MFTLLLRVHDSIKVYIIHTVNFTGVTDFSEAAEVEETTADFIAGLNKTLGK